MLEVPKNFHQKKNQELKRPNKLFDISAKHCGAGKKVFLAN
jgi:hypothetical protein